jgi:hypothetical protein
MLLRLRAASSKGAIPTIRAAFFKILVGLKELLSVSEAEVSWVSTMIRTISAITGRGALNVISRIEMLDGGGGIASWRSSWLHPFTEEKDDFKALRLDHFAMLMKTCSGQ